MLCFVCHRWERKKKKGGRAQEKQPEVLEQLFRLSFDHMRPVQVLMAAGVGMFGPARVLPLPPASVKSFLVTKHEKRNGRVQAYTRLR